MRERHTCAGLIAFAHLLFETHISVGIMSMQRIYGIPIQNRTLTLNNLPGSSP
jgi:hypothetical protein